MTYSNLSAASSRWQEVHHRERAAYADLVEAIKEAERSGVPEAEMVRVTQLARMTVRKWRRKAVEPRGEVFPPVVGS